MNSTLIFWPILLQITIAIAGFMLLGIEKTKAIKAGSVDREKAALDNSAWPDHVLKVSNNIANQFQIPVHFYVLCFMFYSLDAVTTVVLSLAWAFVISRVIHAYIHMSSNFVPARFLVFLIGFVIMVVMAVLAAMALLT